jgi:hypothetical protein
LEYCNFFHHQLYQYQYGNWDNHNKAHFLKVSG